MALRDSSDFTTMTGWVHDPSYAFPSYNNLDGDRVYVSPNAGANGDAICRAVAIAPIAGNVIYIDVRFPSNPGGSGTMYGFQTLAGDSANFLYNSPGNIDAVMIYNESSGPWRLRNAGSNIAIHATPTLDGTVWVNTRFVVNMGGTISCYAHTDDGTAQDEIAEMDWEHLFDTDLVNFVDATTSSYFFVVGVFSQACDYSRYNWTDDGTIGSGNTAPTADAGPDQSVDIIDGADLDGSGSSDPEMDSLTYLWEQTSGPGTLTFDDETLESPHVDADVEGAYGIKLTVDDGEFTDEDTVLITFIQTDEFEKDLDETLDVEDSVGYTIFRGALTKKSLSALLLAKYRDYPGVPQDLSFDSTKRQYFKIRYEDEAATTADPDLSMEAYMELLFDELDYGTGQGSIEPRERRMFIEESDADGTMSWSDAARIWALS